MQLNLQPNKWEFKHTDCEGVEHIIRFEAGTWTEALQNFFDFLRCSGYNVSKQSIAINRTKHPMTDYTDDFLDHYEDGEGMAGSADNTLGTALGFNLATVNKGRHGLHNRTKTTY